MYTMYMLCILLSLSLNVAPFLVKMADHTKTPSTHKLFWLPDTRWH